MSINWSSENDPPGSPWTVDDNCSDPHCDIPKTCGGKHSYNNGYYHLYVGPTSSFTQDPKGRRRGPISDDSIARKPPHETLMDEGVVNQPPPKTPAVQLESPSKSHVVQLESPSKSLIGGLGRSIDVDVVNDGDEASDVDSDAEGSCC